MTVGEIRRFSELRDPVFVIMVVGRYEKNIFGDLVSLVLRSTQYASTNCDFASDGGVSGFLGSRRK